MPKRERRRRRWIAAAASAVLALAAGASAQELKWSGQLRFRSEGFDRTFQSSQFQYDHLQRTRIGLTVPAAEQVQIFVQLQDARVWGAEHTTTTDLHFVDLHQAYADWSRSCTRGTLRLRIGRQELAYGDERIIGPLAWSNVARSFDALQARWTQGRYTGDLAAARLADASEGGGRNDDLFLTYHRFTNAAGDRGLEAYALHRASPGTAFETLLGERHFGSRGRVRVEEEFAYQFGRRAGADLRAFLFTGQLYFKLAPQWTLGGAFDMLSGDDPSDATLQTFDTGRIFHTGHKFYGLIDLAESLAGRAGLLDPRAVVQGPGLRGGTTRLEAHFFRVADSDVPQAPGGAGQGEAALGTEIDFVSVLPVRAQTTLEAGAALFVPGSRLDATGRSDAAVWGYLQGTVQF